MKNFLLAIFPIFLSLNSFSQHTYVQMAVENARWLILHDDIQTYYLDQFYGYKIEGDTVINNVTYKKVYYREFVSVNGDWEPPYLIANEFLFAAIRDDIQEKKVYGIIFVENHPPLNPCPNDVEVELYDFSKSVGEDYIGFCLAVWGPTTIINSVQIENIYGLERVVQYVDNNTFKIIEGVGSDFGLLENFGDPFGGPIHELIHYCVGTDEYCYDGFLLHLSNNEYMNNIKVYPNPFEKIVHISVPQNVSLQSVQVYNLFGKLLLRETNNIEEIDSSDLSDGMYVIKVSTDFGIIYKKIVKKSSM